ncbi:MAG: sulfur carrier protein ThiS [Alphaproteobacteria bacterium]|nr:sulfur carrier protein ThiS [Alphaproteobacteria bacterium]
MKIIINGRPKTLCGTPDLANLLESEGYKGKTVAVARNGTFVSREEYAHTNLEDGDAIEIVAPMQGG